MVNSIGNELTLLRRKLLLSKYTFVTPVGGSVRNRAPGSHPYQFWAGFEEFSDARRVQSGGCKKKRMSFCVSLGLAT
jgi:hypothetical protein